MCSSREGVNDSNASARQPPGQQAATTVVLRWELDRERADPDRHPGSGALGTATVPMLRGSADCRHDQSTERGEGSARRRQRRQRWREKHMENPTARPTVFEDGEFARIMEDVRRGPDSCVDKDSVTRLTLASRELDDKRHEELWLALLKYGWVTFGEPRIIPPSEWTYRFSPVLEFLRARRDGTTELPVPDDLDWFHELAEWSGLSTADVDRAVAAGPTSYDWFDLLESLDEEDIVARCGLEFRQCAACGGRPSRCACQTAERVERYRQRNPQ